MKRLLSSAVLALAAALLVWTPTQTRAQQGGGGRGNFNPEEMRARMMERYREALDVKDDDAWKAIEPRIQKVQEARMAIGFGGGMRMFGGRRGGGGGDNQNADQ